MTRRLFVTGMLRSGTSLAQTLLTNHPQMWVVYQPFHQLYVDVKQLYLDEQGLDAFPPLDDGAPGRCDERDGFPRWLACRKFTAEEVERLARNAVLGKGGTMLELVDALHAAPDSFAAILWSLHVEMARHFHMQGEQVLGSKEVLCEEYLPALLDAGFLCIPIIRDPRAVIASANNGRYRQSVGDRYPLLMLIRLWRKSAAYWLRFRSHPLACAIRYEDLVARPDVILSTIAGRLGIVPLQGPIAGVQLKDHLGQPWAGNSSFGDKSTIDSGSTENWKKLLQDDEIRFIEACTRPELSALGYAVKSDLSAQDILDYREGIDNVRPSYLARHALDAQSKAREVRRLEVWERGRCPSEELRRLYMFPDALPGCRISRT